jgi:dienelactone hydrolase
VSAKRRAAAGWAIAVALLLAAAPPAAAENVVIPPFGAFPAISGYLARPATSAPAPAVLVLHGCEGFGSLTSDTANALAKQGYVALAIDTLKPQHLTNACSNPQAVAESARYAFVSLVWLAAQPYVVPDRLGAIGFSMGAIEVLGLVDPRVPHAPPPGLRAAVAYYPACEERAPDVSVPLLILDGDADDWTPAAPCRKLATDAVAAGKTVQITTYPGATHAFNVQAADRVYLGHTLRYDPKAGADAASKADAFLATYLRTAP